jgi:EAL and modified HD-GYP domain-containing signal transduction protein
VPFIITGAFLRVELEAAYERGAMGSVGVPTDEEGPTVERPALPVQATVLELLRLAHDDAGIDALDAAIKRDAPLMFELLRFVGAAEGSTPTPEPSLRQALAALGRRDLTRWLSRMLRKATGDANAPLTHASLRRALLLEHFAGAASDGAVLREALYLTGAFSLLERSTGTAFDRLFDGAAVPASVRQGLAERTGPCAPYLALLEAIERSDPINSRRHREALGLSALDVNLGLLRAIAASPVPAISETRTGG